ncbi:hypothetical protein X777_14816 [Ooceraea biroi]|uniref:Ciliary microtubule inner protein 2A-C-like domain-containing protein n=1 Tax=Ooceraea biroi TaxID=2015173 RepID=A0A026WRL0_OOCBI|nr:hypothetical protein X777_14816 [Ooceraea biroi]
MTAARRMLTTAEPHYIPGYTGYCPQYRFVCGDTYGKATHKLLLDPTINHAKTLILSNRATSYCEIPSKCDIDVVNARFKRTDPVFVHPMLPGYEGFIPSLNTEIGQRYTVLATQRLAKFERQQLRDKAALNQLREIINVQSRQAESQDLEKRLVSLIHQLNDRTRIKSFKDLKGQVSLEFGGFEYWNILVEEDLGIQGSKKVCGKTFGADTRNAKKWLRRDSSPCNWTSRRRCAHNVL